MRHRLTIGLAALCVLGAGLSLLGPVLGHPSSLVLGAFNSEGPSHMWAYALALRSFLDGGPWVMPQGPPAQQANLSGAATLMGEPIYALYAWLSGDRVSATVLAWNTQFAVALLGASLGAWMLARTLAPRSAGAATALTAIVAWGAFLHQMPGVGRLETLVQFLYPLHVAFLARALRSDRRMDLVAAAASLALVSCQGAIPSVFVAVLEPPIGLALALGSANRGRALRRLAGLALVATLSLLPVSLALLHHPPPAVRTRQLTSVSVDLEQLLPWSADAPFARGYHAVPYPGLVLMGAALLAAWRHRQARLWTALTALILLLSLGLEIRWHDHTLAASPLAWLLHRAPSWVPKTGWIRLGAALPFLPAVAVVLWLRDRPWMLALVASLTIVEHASVAQARHATPSSWDARPPPTLLAQAATQRLVHLPADDLLRLWAWANDDSRFVRSPLIPYPNDPVIHYLLMSLPHGITQFAVHRHAPDSAPTPGCIAQTALLLRRDGYSGLAIRTRQLSAAARDRILATIQSGLGAPTVRQEGLIIWDMEPIVPAECTPSVQNPRVPVKGPHTQPKRQAAPNDKNPRH